MFLDVGQAMMPCLDRVKNADDMRTLFVLALGAVATPIIAISGMEFTEELFADASSAAFNALISKMRQHAAAGN